jgi:Trk K+ transport system NAD-binding subunit
MHNVISLLLRRMRLPLIILISTYAISVLGLTLIPGIDDQGNPWRMDFFHAIYFVSFLGSTIGFGEIPYAFTGAQRMWTTFTIYAAVVSWLYAIGTILTVIQDQAFRRVLAFSSFARKVRRMQEPFYILCGYGDASRLLVRELSERCIHCVVVDKDREKIQDLVVEDLPDYVPGLSEDATNSDTLIAAGLKRPNCRGVIALTGDDQCNLTIAITSKLLAPDLQVICQSDSKDSAANMASFGTDHIIDPFEIFASRFAMMFHSPSMYLVYEWMTAVYGSPLSDFRRPPTGIWVLCGFGRFGKAVREHIAVEGVKTHLIEADPEATGAPLDTVQGRGTEANTLLEADIQDAAGVIAGTDNDANNLSILITARYLNAGLFTVARQNQQKKDPIFKAADIDLVMQPGTIVAQYILGLILAPLLGDFFRLTHDRTEEWANVLVSRIAGVVAEVTPETWELEISPRQAPAVLERLMRGQKVLLKDICSNPKNRSELLPCVPLLIKRSGASMLLPELEECLHRDDQLLFCGRQESTYRIRHIVYDRQALDYIQTGVDRPSGTVWRWLTNARGY